MHLCFSPFIVCKLVSAPNLRKNEGDGTIQPEILEEGIVMSLSPFLVAGGILLRSQEAFSSTPRRKRTAGSRVQLQSLEADGEEGVL